MQTETQPTTSSASLWQHSDFLKVWGGQSVSLLGSEISALALSLTAVQMLDALPAQMGLLSFLGFLPHLLFGIVAGVWVDRLRRKPILIVSDLGRGLILAVIPALALFGHLRIEHLYLVALFNGLLTLFFDIAYASYLPTLVPRQQLVAGNSQLEFSRSVIKVAGPSMAGVLVDLFTAPVAIVLDAFSFVFSAMSLLWVRTPEASPTTRDQRRSISAELKEGIRVVVTDRLLLLIAVSTAVNAFFLSAQGAVRIIFVTRELHLQPALLGLVFGVGSLGSVFGAIAARWLNARLQIGPTIVLAHGLYAVSILMMSLLAGPVYLVAPALALSNILFGLAFVVKGVTVLSFRQSITPDRLQGRVTASIRFLAYCATALGPLFGGGLGSLMGTRPAIVICGLGSLIVALWLLGSPMRRARIPSPGHQHG